MRIGNREPLVLEDDQDPPSRRLRIYGKSAPRMAALGGNPDNEGDSSGRGHSPDREYHDGDPHGRGYSPDYRDSPNVVEEVRFSNWAPGDDVSERVVVAPRVAVRDGKLVLEHYDDDLPSDHEDSSPRMAVLENTIQIMNPMKIIYMETRTRSVILKYMRNQSSNRA